VAVHSDSFRNAFLAWLKLDAEALRVRADAEEAKTQLHRIGIELLEVTGAQTLAEVFAEDPGMLRALELEC
jgi:hypothetical protein